MYVENCCDFYNLLDERGPGNKVDLKQREKWGQVYDLKARPLTRALASENLKDFYPISVR